MSTTTICFSTDDGSGNKTKIQQVDANNPLPVAATVNATAATVAKATAAAPTYSEGDTAAPLSVDLSGNLRTLASVSASIAQKATAADPSYTEGSTTNPLSCDLTGYGRVKAKQSGTWSVSLDASQTIGVTNFPTTVDVNSGAKTNGTLRVVLATDQPALTNKLLVTPDLPSGASTAAKQPALGTAGTASADVITVQGIASMTALKVDGSAVTQPVSGTFWQATQPISAASLPLPSGAATSAKQDSIITALGSPFQAGGSIGNSSFGATQSGTWTMQPGNTANTTPWLVTAGHGKTIKTVDVNITADTDIIAAVTSKRIKVIAYSLDTTGTNANEIIFKSNGAAGTALGRVLLQSQASAVFGRNVAVSAPSFLFATAAGEKLTLDVSQTDAVKGYITYFDDDSS